MRSVKMKTKKTVIAVLTAVLLITAALIVGCMTQLDEVSDKDTKENYQIPKGKGVISIRFADSKARTILPVPDLSSYTYDLLITKGGVPVKNEAALTYTQLTTGDHKAITLDEATGYSISLIAKSGGKAVGGWDNGGTTFDIDEGQDTELTASLTATSTGQGTFTYTIKKATNGTTTFDVFNLAGTISIGDTYYGAVNNGETPSFPITVAGTESGTITLAAGFYLVKVTATSSATQTIQYIHVLHIYDNLDAELEQDLSGITLAVDRFTVTYHIPDTDKNGNYNDGDHDDDVYYGTVLNERNNGVEGPSFDGLVFNGWYTAGDFELSGQHFVMGTNRVFNTLNLYAKTSVPGSATGDLKIDINFDYLDEPGELVYPTDVSKATFFSVGGEVVITASGLTGTLIWNIGGDDINSGLSVGDTVLTINNSSTFAKYFVSDKLVVNVRGDNGSKTITINLGS
jgi:hypothetical protein